MIASAAWRRPASLILKGSRIQEEALKRWNESAEKDPGSLLDKVTLEDSGGDGMLVSYAVATRRAVVNIGHPFAQEHSATHEEQLLLRDVSLVHLLTDAHIMRLGVEPALAESIRAYRDQTERLIARIRRRTGPQIRKLLLEATAHPKGMENVIGDALEYLGFSITRLGQSGEPEGVASAPVTRDAEGQSESYRFTYDAKSSKSGKATTGNIHTAGLNRHRRKHNAALSLVVAPGFESGALEQETKDNGVTPMTAECMGLLLDSVFLSGPIDSRQFKEVFSLHTPNEVRSWVDGFCEHRRTAVKLSVGIVLEALDLLFEHQDNITCSLLADRIRAIDDKYSTIRLNDIKPYVRAMEAMVPSLVQLFQNDETVILGAKPVAIRDAIISQLKDVPTRDSFIIGESLSRAELKNG